MKPMHTLTWAVSAPILLFAGATHAVSLSELTDSGCNGTFVFDSANNKIACQAASAPTAAPSCTVSANTTSVSTNGAATITSSCNQPPILSYAWTTSSGASAISGSGGTLVFGTVGSYTYSVKGTNSVGEGPASNTVTINVSDASQPPPPPSSCPATPAGTTIIAVGGRDDYSKIEFNEAFDAPGNRIDSVSGAGQIKAWEFNNNAYLSGKITGTAGNYGSNYKDWSVSACPGDFSSSLPAKCVKIRTTGLTMYYHASDATKGCVLPAGQKMYLNVRATDPAQAAGYAVSNSPSATLP